MAGVITESGQRLEPMSGAPGEVVEEFPIEILEIERTFYNVALPKDVSEVSRMIELKPRPLCHWNNFSHNTSAWQVSQSLSAEAAVDKDYVRFTIPGNNHSAPGGDGGTI